MSSSVLFLSTMDGDPWGGSEELWFETALHMARAGRVVAASVLQWPQPPKQLDALRRGGIRVIERARPSAAQRVLQRAFPERKFAWLRRLRPGFVVLSQGANWSERTIEAGEALIRLGIPYLVVSHCAYPWHWPDDEAAGRMRGVYHGAAAACFVSQANLSLTRMQMGDPLANARIVRNPFGVDYGAPLPWPEADAPRLAFIGRLNPGVKGHDLLFEALAAEPWKSRNLNVTLYGSGSHADIMVRLRKQFDLGQVSFGGVEEPREIWRRNHALILPSRAEGLPLVIVDAMLCGRPCICTAAGGCAEVVEDEATGFVARDASAAGFGDALERAWSRRGDWQAMGQRAAERIRAFMPPDPVARFAAMIDGLMS